MSRNNTDPPSLDELFRRMKDGDNEATEWLYKTLLKDCYPKVSRFVKSRFGMSEADAQDWFHEVFKDLMERTLCGEKKSFKSFSKLHGYFMNAVRNQAMKNVRRKERPLLPMAEPEDPAPQLDQLGPMAIEVFHRMDESCQSLLRAVYGSSKAENSPRTPDKKKKAQRCIDEFLKRLNQEARGEAQWDLQKIAEEEARKMKGECGKLLKLFYYNRIALKKIAKMWGYAYGTIKNKKVHCMNELNRRIADRLNTAE